MADLDIDLDVAEPKVRRVPSPLGDFVTVNLGGPTIRLHERGEALLLAAVFTKAADLLAPPSLSSLIDGDNTSAASRYLAEQKAERQHELNTAGWDAVDGEVA